MRTILLVSLAVLAAGLVLAASALAQSRDTIKIIAIDADITGNTATSLGPLNACTRVEPGASVTLDLVVDAVPASRGIIGYQFNITYDPAVLEVTAADNEFLLGALGSYEPFEGLSEPLPDSDGNYLIIMADLASGPVGENTESGPGVITRLTFRAKAPGISAVAPQFDPPDIYPSVIDDQNTAIGVDSVAGATVAVGQDCPVPPDSTPAPTSLPPIEEIMPTTTPGPGETPAPSGEASPLASPSPGATPSPTPHATPEGGPGAVDLTEGDGGLSTGAVIAIVVLGLAGAGAVAGGGVMLLRRRGAAPGGDAGA